MSGTRDQRLSQASDGKSSNRLTEVHEDSDQRKGVGLMRNLAENKPSPAAIRPAAPPAILLIEEDPILLRILGLTLMEEGFEIFESGKRGDALTMLFAGQTNAAVLDLIVPQSSDSSALLGAKQIAMLRENEIPFLITSLLSYKDVSAIFGPLPEPFLTKPYNPWELARILRTLISGSTGRTRRGTKTPSGT